MTNSLRTQKLPAIIAGLALLLSSFGIFGQIQAQTVVPTFISLPDVNATATVAGGVAVNYALPVATSTLGGTVNVVCTPATGTIFPIGTTVVTCTATDIAGNTATASFNVNVALSTATSSPVLNFTVNGSTNPPAITVPSGQPYTFTWASANATACQISSPVISGSTVNGTITIQPDNTLFFPTASTPVAITMSCNNGVTSVTRTVVVSLAAIPVATTTPNIIPITVTSSACSVGSNIVVSGTGPLGATIVISGGTGTATTTATGGGAFSATVGLGASTTPLLITAIDPVTGAVITSTTFNATLGGGAAPTISLGSPSTISMFVGNNFSDPGFSFTGIPGTTATTTGFVNASTTGTYTLTYTVTDPCGRTASATRTVEVVNTGGGGGGSSSGSSSSTGSTGTSGVTGSVLPGTVNGISSATSALVPVITPTGLALLPALPNTGLGGDATRNIVSLLVAMAISTVGLAVTLNSRKTRRSRIR